MEQFLHQKAVSHTLDNQRNIWWDPAGRFLGPGRVRNGPIALLKLNVSERSINGKKVNDILKMVKNLHRIVMQGEKCSGAA